MATPSTSSDWQSESPPVPQETGAKSPGAKAKKGQRGKSCAACRIRRVRCERAEGATDCLKCIERRLQCVSMPLVKGLPRRKKDDQALAISNPTGTAETSHRKRRVDEPTLEERSFRSVTSQLVTDELQSAFSASLLDLYLILPKGRMTLLEDGTRFREAFNAAHKRSADLDCQSQALLAIILALAARVSDHPLLVGDHKPSVKQLDFISNGSRDLSFWGQKREDACVALTNEATRLADEAAVWREPSVINIVILVLLEGLRGDLGSSNRPYGDAYMSHIRALLESDDPMGSNRAALKESGLGFLCYMKDASHSAWIGRNSSFSREDFQETLLEGLVPSLPVAMELCSQVVAKEPGWESQFQLVCNSYMIHISDIARDFPATLNGAVALRRPLNVASVQNLLDRLDVASLGITKIDEVALKVYGSSRACTPAQSSYWSVVGALRTSRCGLVIRLRAHLSQRLENRYSIMPAPQLGERYWDGVTDLYNKATTRAFEAAREMCLVIRRNLETGLSFGVVARARYSLARVQPWVSILLDTPTAEEGGPPEFTFSEKLADLYCVRRALCSISWSFESIARSIPWIEYEISLVEGREALYFQRPEILSVIANLDTSLDAALLPVFEGDSGFAVQDVDTVGSDSSQRQEIILKMLGSLVG